MGEYTVVSIPMDSYDFEEPSPSNRLGEFGGSGRLDYIDKPENVEKKKKEKKGGQKLCFIGASHSRIAVEMLDGIAIHISAPWPTDLSYAGNASLINNCSDAVIGIGQHPAGWPRNEPMEFSKYRDEMRAGLVSFSNIVNGSMGLYVRNVHENPLGNRISACPPDDWRNPEVIRVYNEILADVCEELRIPFFDTTDIISPM